MARIAIFVAGLALVMSPPVAAAPSNPVAATVDGAGEAGQNTPEQDMHRRALHNRKIAVALAALTAAILGIIAATNSSGHDHHPASP